MRIGATILAGFSLLPWAVGACAADPAVPLGQDPAGPAIAVVTAGADYTVAPIAARLARDGEGEIIGWDFVDGDPRPYAPRGEETSQLLRSPRFRFVLVRVDRQDPLWIARAAAFTARTPARALALRLGTASTDDWTLLQQSAERFKELTFVAIWNPPPAPSQPGDAVAPAALPANLVAVAADTCATATPTPAPETVAGLVALLCADAGAMPPK